MQSAQRPQFEKFWYNSKTSSSSSTFVCDMEKSFRFSGFLVPLLQNRWIILTYFTCEWWDSNLFILLHTYQKKKKNYTFQQGNVLCDLALVCLSSFIAWYPKIILWTSISLHIYFLSLESHSLFVHLVNAYPILKLNARINSIKTFLILVFECKFSLSNRYPK